MESLDCEGFGNGTVLCCDCGTPIQPNPANMCAACIRSRVDITEGIPRQSHVSCCKFCGRYFMPPNSWIYASPESKELLSLALKKLKPFMLKVRLTDASFVWTEPHSKRIKVKLTIQKEVLTSAVLQQSFIVEFVIQNQMCEDCRRAEAKDYWRACVQVRQKCDFKKTLFYLEQLVLKHGIHEKATGVKPVATGIDFFYAKLQDARKLVDFLLAGFPCRYRQSQELVTHDTKSNIYDYKHTFCVEIVPICRDNIVCVPVKVAQALGNMNQLLICLRISNVITLIDPSTLQVADVTATQYWRTPFNSLCQPRQLSEFYIINVEDVGDVVKSTGAKRISRKHRLADAWVVPSNQVGVSNVEPICTRTHLGLLLKPGDLVMGFDVKNSNVNDPVFDKISTEKIPDVILVKKVYDRATRQKRRLWKLKRLVTNGNIVADSASVENDFQEFMEDLEEDEQMREKINIYRDKTKVPAVKSSDLDFPEGPSLEEMLEDLEIDDVEMTEA